MRELHCNHQILSEYEVNVKLKEKRTSGYNIQSKHPERDNVVVIVNTYGIDLSRRSIMVFEVVIQWL